MGDRTWTGVSFSGHVTDDKELVDERGYCSPEQAESWRNYHGADGYRETKYTRTDTNGQTEERVHKQVMHPDLHSHTWLTWSTAGGAMSARMIWRPGDVLIVRGSRRAVIVTECPEMFDGRNGHFPDLSHRVWGYHSQKERFWAGPWHGDPDNYEPHPDPDAVWKMWAEYCASKLSE